MFENPRVINQVIKNVFERNGSPFVTKNIFDRTSSSPQPPFTNGILCWYDAFNVNNDGIPQPSDGSPLAGWRDVTGSGHLLSAPAEENTPVFSANAFGLNIPGVTFDGVDSYMNLASNLLLGDNFTLFSVVKTPNPTVADGIILASKNNVSGAYQLTRLASGTAIYFYNGSGTPVTTVISASSAARCLTIKQETFDAENTYVFLYLNGSELLNTYSPNNPAAFGQVGALGGANPGGGDSATGFFEGDIGEIVVFNRALSDVEIASFYEDYLKPKFNIV